MKYRDKYDLLIQARCDVCRYWFVLSREWGLCRRNPPPWDKKKHRTESEDWCGEFTPEIDEI